MHNVQFVERKKSKRIFYRQFPIAIETISTDFLQWSLPDVRWRGEQLESDKLCATNISVPKNFFHSKKKEKTMNVSHESKSTPFEKRYACIDCVVMSLLHFLTIIDCGGLSLFLSRLETDATFDAVQTSQQIFSHFSSDIHFNAKDYSIRVITL